ncbi:MAG: acetylglutamate kinase [Deltaproteobacteria bacterium]|jgi:acetylglutamate kinase|nr:acetylglutamate kinase [Deltaproteobacteria bacterium]
MSKNQEQARLLIECLPYIRTFFGETVVIKYGGHAMEEAGLREAFALNIALLRYVGIKPVIVHGGGPQIGEMLEQLHIPSSFWEGQRITDEATMSVVEMVLVGRVNNEIVNALNLAGVKAVGLSGKDGHIIRARKLKPATGKGKEAGASPGTIDLGRVGEVSRVETGLLGSLGANGFIPVIAPVGVDEQGGTYNINADSAAGAVASALKAKRLLLLTDVRGVLDSAGELIPSLNPEQIRKLFADGSLSGGMIPKLGCCLEALRGGVEKAVILDGRVENCILLELFTASGVGTEVTSRP